MSWADYRKKPVVIQAIQWDGEERTYQLVLARALKVGRSVAWLRAGERLLVETLEGEMAANKGDWIIQGVEGELYPCKPGIFAKTYEVAT